MLTNIDGRILILDRGSMPDYWGAFFHFERQENLYRTTEIELLAGIDEAKRNPRPFIDSQQLINAILTRFGERHIFHRDFNAQCPGSNSAQVLGMQLYKLMIDDPDTWIYHDIQHPGHPFPHATYFQQ
jgi:hypothetical protein